MTLDDKIDVVKVGVATAAPGLHVLGVSVQDWTFVLSGIVSLLFIIEKLPMLISRIKALIKWMKEVKKE